MKLKNILNINNFSNFFNLKVIRKNKFNELKKYQLDYNNQIYIKNNTYKFISNVLLNTESNSQNIYKNITFDFLALTNFEHNQKVLFLNDKILNFDLETLEKKFNFKVSKVNDIKDFNLEYYSLIVLKKFNKEIFDKLIFSCNYFYLDETLPSEKDNIISYFKSNNFSLKNSFDIGFGLIFEKN